MPILFQSFHERLSFGMTARAEATAAGSLARNLLSVLKPKPAKVAAPDASRRRSTASARSISFSDEATILASRGCVLAMPASRPADRVNNRDVGAVAADQLGGQLARLLEHVVFFRRGRRLIQPPVQMQLRLDLAGFGVRPFAARRNDNGRRAENGLKGLPRLLRVLVAFDAEGNTLVQVFGLCVLGVAKRRDGRAENSRLRAIQRPGGRAQRACPRSLCRQA